MTRYLDRIYFGQYQAFLCVGTSNKTSSHCKQDLYWWIRAGSKVICQMTIRYGHTKAKSTSRRIKTQRQAMKATSNRKTSFELIINRRNKNTSIKNKMFETSNLELIISMTEVNSKIYKPRLFDKTVNNPIHGRRWKKAITEELQNLENHQTWKYKELPPKKKAIGSKYVFKVKYHPNGLIARFKARLMA